MTKEERKIVKKTLELVHQIFKEQEESSVDFESFKETLVDDYIEWDNGYSKYLFDEIEERLSNEKD